MTSRVIVPFDNNPTSTSIKTTAYTVPAGKYARVQNLTGDLTIDGVDCFVILDSFTRTLTATSFANDYIETFGNCTNGVCPPQIYPKRPIRPGYSTPICSTEKYEKITCKSAESLYKQVLELRYGISNCCPEEDDKWLLKKQIIDLQALVDPDYTCVLDTCGCPPASCGCGTTNSCNSH